MTITVKNTKPELRQFSEIGIGEIFSLREEPSNRHVYIKITPSSAYSFALNDVFNYPEWFKDSGYFTFTIQNMDVKILG